MLKVTVSSHSPAVVRYTDKRTGELREILKQTAYLHAVDADGRLGEFPDKFEFFVPRERDGLPYAPGEYTLHPSAIAVTRDGALSCAVRLTPVKPKG